MTDGTTRRYNDGEVLSGVQRRRRWTPEEKVRIVEETYLPGMTVSLVARRHGIGGNQIFTWRRLMAQGALTAATAGEEVVPASEYRALEQQVRELHRLLGKKANREGVHHVTPYVVVTKISHPGELQVPLGCHVRQLRQRLCLRNADAGGYCRPLLDLRPHGVDVGDEIPALKPGEIKERLVDRVNLEITGEGLAGGDHAALHVTIKRIVRRPDLDAVLPHLVAQMVDRIAHFDPERLRFGRSGYCAPVVIRQHDDGHADQAGVEGPLARHVIVVAVDQGDRRAHVILRATPTTVPQISTCSSTRMSANPSASGTSQWRPST